jgi:hypothetical protein
MAATMAAMVAAMVATMMAATMMATMMLCQQSKIIGHFSAMRGVMTGRHSGASMGR